MYLDKVVFQQSYPNNSGVDGVKLWECRGGGGGSRTGGGGGERFYAEEEEEEEFLKEEMMKYIMRISMK